MQSRNRIPTPAEVRSFTKLGVRAVRCFLADIFSNNVGVHFIRGLLPSTKSWNEFLAEVHAPRKRKKKRGRKKRRGRPPKRKRKKAGRKPKTVDDLAAEHIIGLPPADLVQRKDHDPRVWDDYTKRVYNRYIKCATRILTDGTWENLGVKRAIYWRVGIIEPHEFDVIFAQWEPEELANEAYIMSLKKLRLISRYQRIYRIMKTAVRNSITGLRYRAQERVHVPQQSFTIDEVLFGTHEPWCYLTPLERHIIVKKASGEWLSGYREDRMVHRRAIANLQSHLCQHRHR